MLLICKRNINVKFIVIKRYFLSDAYMYMMPNYFNKYRVISNIKIKGCPADYV